MITPISTSFPPWLKMKRGKRKNMLKLERMRKFARAMAKKGRLYST
jgi:hypothetical protein